MRPLSLPSSTLKLWDYSKGKVSRGGAASVAAARSQGLGGRASSGGVPARRFGAGLVFFGGSLAGSRTPAVALSAPKPGQGTPREPARRRVLVRVSPLPA